MCKKDRISGSHRFRDMQCTLSTAEWQLDCSVVHGLTLLLYGILVASCGRQWQARTLDESTVHGWQSTVVTSIASDLLMWLMAIYKCLLIYLYIDLYSPTCGSKKRKKNKHAYIQWNSTNKQKRKQRKSKKQLARDHIILRKILHKIHILCCTNSVDSFI